MQLENGYKISNTMKMAKFYPRILTLALLFLPCAQSFTTPLSRSAGTFDGSLSSSVSFSPLMRTVVTLHMSSENPTPRRRRKRKDGKTAESMKAEAPVEEVQVSQPSEIKDVDVVVPKAEPVQMQVTDIRDVVSGKVSTPEPKAKPQATEEYDDDDDELEDDEEYEYYYEDENNNEVIVGTSSSKDNSLEALLADAKRMRESEKDSKEDEEDGSIAKTARSVISTIVTVDFFVVCALLAWFLAGIFCSYIIKDDTVQIAFNGIFEPVVQPALGVLMIASAAGAAFDDSDKDQ